MLFNNWYTQIFHYTQGEPITNIGCCDYHLPISIQQWLVDVQMEEFACQDIKFDAIIKFKNNRTEVWTSLIWVKDFSLIKELQLDGQ